MLNSPDAEMFECASPIEKTRIKLLGACLGCRIMLAPAAHTGISSNWQHCFRLPSLEVVRLWVALDLSEARDTPCCASQAGTKLGDTPLQIAQRLGFQEMPRLAGPASSVRVRVLVKPPHKRT